MYSEKNPKIDIYIDGKYFASTNFSKTCREAVEKIISKYPFLKDHKAKGKKSK
jgi:hypothetical protein